MNQRLRARIARIERMLPPLPAPAAPTQSPVQLLAGWLAAWGIERGTTESLAETTARAMGVSVRELRAKLCVLADRRGARA